MKPLTHALALATAASGITLGAVMPAVAAPGDRQTTVGAAVSHPAPAPGGRKASLKSADLACRVFVEQDDFSSPLNRNGTTATPNRINGATVGCSSPNGEFARGNGHRRPVLLSSSYTSVGGPSVNNVVELHHNCTTIVQNAELEFTWNTGDVSIGRISIDADGNAASEIIAGVMAGDSFTFTGPAAAHINSYVTYLGSCSADHTAGEADGFIVNPWLPGETGSTGNEVGLTFARG